MIIMHIRSEEKNRAICEIADRIGEKVLKIGGRELNRTLIGLYSGKELTGDAKIPPMYQMPELLVFAVMPEKKLDAFLEAYRAEGLEPVALKAVTTLHNAGWTVYELIEQLKKECGGNAAGR